MLKTVLAILLALSLSAQASGQPRKSKFLLVSDLHFNSMADRVLVKELAAAEPVAVGGNPRSHIAEHVQPV